MTMTSFPDATVIQDDGIYVADHFRIYSPPEQAFDWTPAYEMDWPGAPNPITAPALPIPFTAGELSAFMLDGIGYALQECLDRRIGYPLDDVALEHFGKRKRLVREALRSAYDLAERAQSVVGEYDYAKQRRACDLMEQFDAANGHANEHEGVFAPGITSNEASQRRARAVASVADLGARALKAKAEEDAKWAAWRAAMVKQLLHPEPQATTPSPAPVVADSASDGAPMLKQPAQEARILELLTSKGHDPLNLADRPSGGRGAKHEIRVMALLEPALFTKKTFDTAWQRLRDDGRLVGGD